MTRAGRRRANGEGCIRRLPSGNWQWRITLGFKDGKQVQKVDTEPTRRAASQAMAKAIADRDQGLLPLPSAVTVEEWVRRYLWGARMQLALSTQGNYLHIAERHLFPLLGNVTVQALRPAQVRDAYATLVERGYSASVLRQVRAILNRALQEAVIEELVPRNVAAQVDLPITKPPVRASSLGIVETQTFLAVARSHALGVLFEVSIATGLRRSEVCGLKWKWVDLIEGIIQVRETLVMVRGRPVLGPPKTETSVRDVMISPEMLALLREHQFQQCSLLGRITGPDDFVFSWPDGRFIHPEYLTRQTALLTQKAGLGRLRFHDLCHTHTDLQVHLGVPAEIISQQLGHSRVEFTLSRYRHVRNREAKQHAMSLSSLLEAAL